MRVYTKSFRVAMVQATGRGNGTTYCVIIASDAETWQFVLGPERPIPCIGEDIELPLRLVTYPREDRQMCADLTDCFGMTEPVKYDLYTPFKTVAEIWGTDEAARFLDEE